MDCRIPFFSFEKINQDIQGDLETAFHSVIDSKWYILGNCLQSFENKFAQYINVKHAIGVGNGMDALRISLEALDLKPDDEIIIPSFTFIATLLAVIHSGAKPVLADVNPDNCVLDADSINRSITLKTKVILPVHLYGYPCNMKEIKEMAASLDIYVIEDYAQSVGAEVGGLKTGSFGQINATSFYPTKTLGALGDGGMITTNNGFLADRCRKLRNYGFEDKIHHKLIGYNSRLDELQAALLTSKMKYLDKWIDERKSIALNYLDKLNELPGLILPSYSEDTRPSYHIFPVRMKNRDALKEYLWDAGIGTMVHYSILPHLQDSMKHLGYGINSFPVAEEIARTELSLPIYPGLTDADIGYIASKIKEFFRSN